MKERIEVFIFVDALGWRIAEEYGFLRDELPYRKKVEMQFGYSSSAIPTILSGVRPAEHGQLGLFCYNPARSPFRIFRYLHWLLHPGFLWDRGRMRGYLSRFVNIFYGFTGYFQLYRMPFRHLPEMDFCEKKDLFAPSGMAPCRNLCDTLSETGLKFHISNWRIGDKANLDICLDSIRSEKHDFMFIYTAALDGVLHSSVNDPDAIKSKLTEFEGRLREILAAGREHAREFHFTVISDHGMTPLRGSVDLLEELRKTGLVRGKDYGACFDSTMMRMHFLKPGVRETVFRTMEAYASSGHWLSEEEEKRYGIWREDRRFGDAIFLLNPGIQQVPSDMGKRPLNGMHGFAPEDIDSAAAILSTEPIPGYVSHVADYFRLMMERALELKNKKE